MQPHALLAGVRSCFRILQWYAPTPAYGAANAIFLRQRVQLHSGHQKLIHTPTRCERSTKCGICFLPVLEPEAGTTCALLLCGALVVETDRNGRTSVRQSRVSHHAGFTSKWPTKVLDWQFSGVSSAMDIGK